MLKVYWSRCSIPLVERIGDLFLGILFTEAEHFHQHALVFGALVLCKSENFHFDACGHQLNASENFELQRAAPMQSCCRIASENRARLMPKSRRFSL
ncbi:hypothetical protein [Paraburkholderia graminis]|uniref:Uncharacterized protein n=1 Tax=Paraburkholderia graminis TaxID=60548 RepID=A0ABD5C7Y7_9BURK|nr:hypothetical protein [Paraburkholderia graminis]MDR6201384.1 hypothetical protein [Paraburkholderia graminis]